MAQNADLKLVSSPISTQSAKELDEYWTSERMASAIPLKGQVVDGKPQSGTLSQPDGPAGFSKAYPGDDGGQPAFTSAEINVSQPLAYPYPFTVAYAPTPTTTYPWRAVGKVYFTQGSSNYVCSGAAITPYAIFTAGHCVWSVSLRAWSTNFRFVPGYYGGTSPYGSFNNYQLWAPNAYTATTSTWAYDIGAAVLQRSGGNGVGNIVGYFGIGWNYAYSLSWRALSYPSDSPFSGEWDYYCDAAFATQDTAYSPNTVGIGCDATNGASGGPWVYQFGSNNYINGVFSYRYGNQPNAWYSPYFGSAAQALYNSVNSITPP